MRRDFFDLFVILNLHQLGILECIRSARMIYGDDFDEGLFLRAICYFDDADRERALPSEGENDWAQVKHFFSTRALALIAPPAPALEIQSHTVDLDQTRK